MGEYHHDFEADEDFLNKTKIKTANWTSLKNCVQNASYRVGKIFSMHMSKGLRYNFFFFFKKKKTILNQKTTRFLR